MPPLQEGGRTVPGREPSEVQQPPAVGVPPVWVVSLMTKSVYIIGGAGAGKSTFTSELLAAIGEPLGPLEDLHTKRNAKGTPVTLRGHRIGGDGLSIGCMRESFPGTDGLDRASSISGEAWLEAGQGIPSYIVSEGATLATRRFLGALHTHTDLLLVHLDCADFVRELRFLQRGSTQAENFVKITVTRSRNLLADMAKAGVKCWEVDTANPPEWEQALDVALSHLLS